MKYLCYVLIIVSCGCVGNIIKVYYENKVKLFESLIFVCQKFESEVVFFQTKIGEFFETILGNITISSRFLYTSFLESVKTQDYRLLQNAIKKTNLNSYQQTQLYNFFNELGKSDSVSQAEIASNYKIIFENELKSSKLQFEKYGKMSLKLSLLFGIVVIILLM